MNSLGKKILLIAVLAIGAVFNFRLFSFKRGFVTVANEQDNVASSIRNLISIEKIEYYNHPLKGLGDKENEYILIVKTADKNYLYNSTENDIKALSVGGFFVQSIKPEKLSVIPLPVFVVGAVIILFLPLGRIGKTKTKSE